MPDFLPKANPALVLWFNTFAASFAQNAAEFGFTPADVAAVNADAAFVQTLNNRVEILRKESQEAVAYRRLMLDAPLGTPATGVPQNAAPALPDSVPTPGVIARVRALAARIKAHPRYSDALGKELGIVGTGTAPGANPLAKPSVSTTTAGANTVDVAFVKNGYEAVLLESQRGTETAWTPLGNVRYSPHRDARPNLAPGVPDVRRYRAIYLVKDKITGQYSDTVTITVL